MIGALVDHWIAEVNHPLVGGSRGLVDGLLDSSALEVWEVDPEVSLQADADGVNAVPDD